MLKKGDLIRDFDTMILGRLPWDWGYKKRDPLWGKVIRVSGEVIHYKIVHDKSHPFWQGTMFGSTLIENTNVADSVRASNYYSTITGGQ